MSGKTVLVTGASSGIGHAAARRLAAAGATVLVHGRSPDRTDQVAREVGTEPLVADFARFDEVRSLAERVLTRAARLDVMLHNAGALIGKRTETRDGHELTFQTNHLSPFLLQRLLEPLIVSTAGSRVIVVSSAANRAGRVQLDDLDCRRRHYSGFRAYAATKLENILFVRELSRRLAGTGTASVAVHPGNVATGFGSASTLPGLFYRLPIKSLYLVSAEEGAEPLVYLAGMPDPQKADGLYYDRLKPRGKTAAEADDAALAAGLWELSEMMVGPWLASLSGSTPARMGSVPTGTRRN